MTDVRSYMEDARSKGAKMDSSMIDSIQRVGIKLLQHGAENTMLISD